VTLEEYDRLKSFHEYSSWAYFVDIVRIYDRHVAPFLHDRSQATQHNLEFANQRIYRWRFRITKRKMCRVGEDGMFDMIIYHAVSSLTRSGASSAAYNLPCSWRSLLGKPNPLERPYLDG
jgi:hypothetical protein